MKRYIMKHLGVMELRCKTLQAIKQYSSNGYATMSVQVAFNEETGKKRTTFKPGWQKATVDNCVQEFYDSSWNGVSILTGDTSDLLLLDIDIPKEQEVATVLDGRVVMDDLIKAHGLNSKVPQATTASGGRHYFFSMSGSIANGLENVQNRSKVLYKGRPTTIDVRGDRGNVFVEPTTYSKRGEMCHYSFQTPLCPSADLLPAPFWVIDLLNADKKMAQPHQVGLKRKAGPDSKGAVLWEGNDDDNHIFYSRVKSCVETSMKADIDRLYHRDGGFDFSLVDKLPCIICQKVHTSNHYMCRQILTDCYWLRNYSGVCNQMVFHYKDNYIVKRVLESPTTDQPYVQMVQYSISYVGMELRVSGDKHTFYCFNGNHWTKVHETSFQQQLRLLSYNALNDLCNSLAIMLKNHIVVEHSSTEEMKAHLKIFNNARNFIQKAGSISAITTSAKQLLWDQELSQKLDTNRDLIGVPGGVVNLRTGAKQKGSQTDYVSKVLDTEYRGVDHPTPNIDAFFWSLFEDQQVVDYLQVLLGYGITGHVKEQCWLIAHGCGSNGKGVVQNLLQALLGDYFVNMSPDCIIKRGRAPGKGAPTPYLADLCGARLAVCDELPSDAVLDEELVKRATGDTVLHARYLNANEFAFEPTHLAILLTNHKPKIDIEDEGMLRRVVFLPFEMQFKRPEQLDPTDITHRPMQRDLVEKLTTPECKEELLTWLVRGGVKWYSEGLPTPPPKMQAAKEEYLEENDDLAQFIKEYCIVGNGLRVETKQFQAAFESTCGGKTVSAAVLKKKMEGRGYSKRQLTPKQHSSRPWVYLNLALVD